jgi:DNA invertase Pin-like site-specific DNA recombinase
VGKAVTKRAALYVRVSSDQQTVENQIAELRRAVDYERWTEVAIYRDEGISGTKGREQRPGLDAMLKDARKRRFDVVMVWSIDRLGRSLPNLLATVAEIHKCKVDLYLQRERIDTTSDVGEMIFRVLATIAEYERKTIRRRADAGLNRVKAELESKGKFTARKSGIVRTKLGRPDYADPQKIRAAKAELAKGLGIRKVAGLVGLGVGTVHRLKREQAATA